MKKLIWVLSFMVALISVAGCGNPNEITESDENTAKPDGILVMGTSADSYPFQFIEVENGEELIVGFDIDIAKYIADALGYELEIVDMDFNTLITALRSGRVHMVLADMSPTDRRRKVVDFSDVYYQSNPGLILTSDRVTLDQIQDLSGRTIGVQTGSLQEEIGNDLIEDGIDVELLVMDRVPDLVQQLLTGRIDAVIVNLLTAQNYAQNHNNLMVVDLIENVELGAAIAFPQGSDLTAKVNEVLADMEEEGKMAELIKYWFVDSE